MVAARLAISLSSVDFAGLFGRTMNTTAEPINLKCKRCGAAFVFSVVAATQGGQKV